MAARKLHQSDVVSLTGIPSSNLSRLVSGKREIPTALRPVLAKALECPEGTLFDPIGSLVPAPLPTIESLVRGVAPGFEARWIAAAKLPELERLVGLLYFLVSGKEPGEEDT